MKITPQPTCIRSHNERLSQGFSLFELMLVTVSIVLLASYDAPRFFAHLGKSEAKVARAKINAFDEAITTYRLGLGLFSLAEQCLDALVKTHDGVTKWQGPCLKNPLLLNPCGYPYIYKHPGIHSDFDIQSLGRDGKSGSESKADIGNW